MAVFEAYSDEAGVADPAGEFLISGYVADQNEWPWVTRAWQDRVLDGTPKLPYLHMTKIRSEQWRQRHGISFNESEERVAEAVRVLRSMGALSALCSVIKRGDLETAIHSKFEQKKQVPIGLDEPDYLCFVAHAAFVLGEVSKKYPDASRVNFVVSRKQKVTHHLNETVKWMKQNFNEVYPAIAPLFGDLRPGSMELELQL